MFKCRLTHCNRWALPGELCGICYYKGRSDEAPWDPSGKKLMLKDQFTPKELRLAIIKGVAERRRRAVNR